MEKVLLDFIQHNSPDGGFLQSVYWRSFQESVGRKTHTINITDENGETIVLANILTHSLSVVGNYFYVPRGPVFEKTQNTETPARLASRLEAGRQNTKQNTKHKTQNFIEELLKLAKVDNAGWIRIEPDSEENLSLIKENLPRGVKIKKSAVDMQPREILVMDISKSEEDILAGMKQKTRYNIRLAEKRGVKIISNIQYPISKNYIEAFLRLVRVTSERDKIKSHPESYYRKMFEVIPSNILKLYIAEYEGKIIVTNLVLFFGKTATYMHGASDNSHRDVMAPYLLQWRQMQDAKKVGCAHYDFGGVKTSHYSLPTKNSNNWAGITKFKTGFAPEAKPIEFPGSYDIVLNPAKYKLYRMIQKAKSILS